MNQCNNDSVVLISSRPRLQGALGAALGAVVAGLALTGGQAKALTVPVTVGGQNYDVTTFTGTYNDDPSKFSTSTDMPWWGSSDLAFLFASAVGSSLGDSLNGTGFGPLFAYSGTSGLNTWFLNSNLSLNGSISNDPGAFGPGNGPTTSRTKTFAIATLASSNSSSASVPGPLPILGVAAAFGFSRQLRKRIKSSTNTVPSSSAS